jgi:hypothetical protein
MVPPIEVSRRGGRFYEGICTHSSGFKWPKSADRESVSGLPCRISPALKRIVERRIWPRPASSSERTSVPGAAAAGCVRFIRYPGPRDSGRRFSNGRGREIILRRLSVELIWLSTGLRSSELRGGTSRVTFRRLINHRKNSSAASSSLSSSSLGRDSAMPTRARTAGVKSSSISARIMTNAWRFKMLSPGRACSRPFEVVLGSSPPLGDPLRRRAVRVDRDDPHRPRPAVDPAQRREWRVVDRVAPSALLRSGEQLRRVGQPPRSDRLAAGRRALQPRLRVLNQVQCDRFRRPGTPLIRPAPRNERRFRFCRIAIPSRFANGFPPRRCRGAMSLTHG